MKESPLNGKNILVVDDEVELRKAIIFDLKRRGCKTYEASNGNEAFKIVCEQNIHIVVSDVRMPESNGVDLLKQIREKYPKIPVVVLATGFADLTEIEALQLGAYALLDKPFDRKKILGLLENSCSQIENEDAK